MKKKIALFASGSGTNAENIFRSFESHPNIEVAMLISNKADAGVWERFRHIPISKIIISKNDLSSQEFLAQLASVDYIILAGFLLLIPPKLIRTYPNKIINIHPSLLPKYGGKGMYGDHVHEAVLEHKESESGITIHLVNEEYDKGRILFQAKCIVDTSDTIERLRAKIHGLEMEYFPKVIEAYILKDKA